jgi:putative salt-induced outer membrane protein
MCAPAFPPGLRSRPPLVADLRLFPARGLSGKVAAFFTHRMLHQRRGVKFGPRESHTMVKKSIAIAGVALMLHGLAQAADASSADGGSSSASRAGSSQSAQAGTWAAQGQLGLIVTSANTSSRSGNARFDAAHRMGRWTLSGGLAALYASSGQYSTQQDTNAHLQLDLELSPRTFWFSTARWDRNLFTGFAYQESVASGGGFKFIQTHSTLLAGELGLGYRREQPEILTTNSVGGVISRVRQPVTSDAVLQAGLNYSHAITHDTKLVNTLLVQYGASDTTTTDNLSVRVKVDASLSLAVGAQVVSNSNPPPGSVRHTDTVMTVNLVYALQNQKLSATAGTPVTVNGFNLP